MHKPQIITRRGFLDRSMKIGLGVAMASLTDIPFVMKRALAEGNIGLNGKKLLFIFLRGGMDGLNAVIPAVDSAYNTDINPATGLPFRNVIAVPRESDAYYQTGGCDFPVSGKNEKTFAYSKAIRLGNGFAALHPSLKFLAPVYQAGQLAVIHRVGYPKQSRSHFDSQNYWESGNPNNNLSKDGIFYRTILESGLASSSPLTGVSIQSALPMLLRGSKAAMTNLSDPTRYNLFGIPNDTSGNLKADNFLNGANPFPFPDKLNRDLLRLQYGNLSGTLSIFSALNFGDSGNTFVDDENTDGDYPYHLFPTSQAKNGGWTQATLPDKTDKYVVDSGAYSFFNNLKASAMILNHTDAIIAGTELGSFDTHNVQGSVTGTMPNLLRRLGWSIYALRKYFMNNGNKADWNNLVIVTMSEFGRTSAENSSGGTDHAEGGLMLLAGGGVEGGVYGCSDTEFSGAQSALNWATGANGTMFSVNKSYVKRVFDYRSIMGEVIRDHLGATPAQLARIIPGYANPGEYLVGGGTSAIDSVQIYGELGLV